MAARAIRRVETAESSMRSRILTVPYAIRLVRMIQPVRRVVSAATSHVLPNFRQVSSVAQVQVQPRRKREPRGTSEVLKQEITPNIVSMTREDVAKAVEKIGLPKYRAQQIWKWVHHKGVCNFDEMTDLPKRDRAS